MTIRLLSLLLLSLLFKWRNRRADNTYTVLRRCRIFYDAPRTRPSESYRVAPDPISLTNSGKTYTGQLERPRKNDDDDDDGSNNYNGWRRGGGAETKRKSNAIIMVDVFGTLLTGESTHASICNNRYTKFVYNSSIGVRIVHTWA